MSSKFITSVLIAVTILSLAFGFYSYNRSSKLERETNEWKLKYEEALVDAEEAGQRLERLNEQLQAALEEAKRQEALAVKAMEDAQRKKYGK
ncbi:hypothetical protein QQ054_15110 [Oscillatoria amoena NRMC-F 0135]|nr:hypothetical protein [Oscillatoria amoena NRMC-F 0135]